MNTPDLLDPPLAPAHAPGAGAFIITTITKKG
jgi:hypothetical protein